MWDQEWERRRKESGKTKPLVRMEYILKEFGEKLTTEQVVGRLSVGNQALKPNQ